MINVHFYLFVCFWVCLFCSYKSYVVGVFVGIDVIFWLFLILYTCTPHGERCS